MSSTERYRKTGEAFDTLELVFSKNPLNNDNVIETITVFDPKTGNDKLKFYYNANGFITKIETFSIGHDVEQGYVGSPTGIFLYTEMPDGSIRCEFRYLRSQNKLYMKGILVFGLNNPVDDYKLVRSAHYLPDGVNEANVIEWDEVTSKYTLTEHELDNGVSKVVLEAKFDQNKLPTGIWKLHAKSVDDNRDIMVEINTLLQDVENGHFA